MRKHIGCEPDTEEGQREREREREIRILLLIAAVPRRAVDRILHWKSSWTVSVFVCLCVWLTDASVFLLILSSAFPETSKHTHTHTHLQAVLHVWVGQFSF